MLQSPEGTRPPNACSASTQPPLSPSFHRRQSAQLKASKKIQLRQHPSTLETSLGEGAAFSRAYTCLDKLSEPQSAKMRQPLPNGSSSTGAQIGRALWKAEHLASLVDKLHPYKQHNLIPNGTQKKVLESVAWENRSPQGKPLFRLLTKLCKLWWCPLLVLQKHKSLPLQPTALGCRINRWKGACAANIKYHKRSGVNQAGLHPHDWSKAASWL